ncbi:hypothetical protein IC235_13620 [Hymenobacter sp. BT664]|uniref:Uncharacterized protein n=1 Tax=Hymenobacter montanus TaxID=2771359 RepID=A0A927BFE6_9BACT|nr:hypothetical protein [Hymenobacter montanus]MBD2768928.1 hypothetical protein [Hymenobacter montanus]
MLSVYCRRLYLLALVGLATTACSPTYWLELKPARPAGLFNNGRAQAQAVADNVEVRLRFVHYEPTRVVFEAEYHNSTNHPVVVDPTAFKYEVSRAPAPVAAPRTKRPKPLPDTQVTAAVAAASMSLPLPPLPPRSLAAYDPEPEITALREGSDKAAAKAARVDWLGLALGAVSMATDIASIGKRETVAQYQSRAAIQNVAVTYNVISSATKMEQAVAADLMQQRAAQLQEYALRKVTLAPGYEVRGYVYFPRYDAADSVVVQAPVGSRTVPLKFVQVRTRQ